MIPRRLIVGVISLGLLLPASAGAHTCCRATTDARPRLASACCCPADCVVQPTAHDRTTLRLGALQAPASQSHPWRLASAAPVPWPAPSRLMASATGPPRCTASTASSCHAVSLPLRL